MNTINEISLISPDNAVESCAEFFIDEPDQAYTLIDTLVDGRKYTFSCWVKALAAGTITAEGETFEITTEWKKIAVSFTANSTQLQIKFSPGTYHVHHPMLETGNKASDWTPNPDDVDHEISLKVGSADFTGENIISKINLAPGAALIEAAHINLRGSVTISDLDDNLGSSFVTDEDGVTQIDGGNIKTGTITALGEVTAGSFDIGSGKFKVSEDGILEATDAIIRGTVYATDGEFTGKIHATSGDFAGKVEARSGSIGLFDIDPNWGFNSSYFHDSDAVNYEMFLYGKLRHYTVTDYGQYVYRVLEYTHKGGDPDTNEWKGETHTLIGAVDDGADGFKTLIHNSRGGHILLNEGVELCGTYVSLPSEVNFANSENARQAIGIDVGYVDATTVDGVLAGSYKDVLITFKNKFSEVPYVYLTLISTSQQSDIGSMSAVPMSRSTTGATIRIYNDSDARREPGIQWVAIG